MYRNIDEIEGKTIKEVLTEEEISEVYGVEDPQDIDENYQEYLEESINKKIDFDYIINVSDTNTQFSAFDMDLVFIFKDKELQKVFNVYDLESTNVINMCGNHMIVMTGHETTVHYCIETGESSKIDTR